MKKSCDCCGGGGGGKTKKKKDCHAEEAAEVCELLHYPMTNPVPTDVANYEDCCTKPPPGCTSVEAADVCAANDKGVLDPPPEHISSLSDCCADRKSCQDDAADATCAEFRMNLQSPLPMGNVNDYTDCCEPQADEEPDGDDDDDDEDHGGDDDDGDDDDDDEGCGCCQQASCGCCGGGGPSSADGLADNQALSKVMGEVGGILKNKFGLDIR